MAAGERQPPAEQVRAIGQAAARARRPRLPIDASQAGGLSERELAALVFQPGTGRRFPSVCHAFPIGFGQHRSSVAVSVVLLEA
jgi:hypothetical protein